MLKEFTLERKTALITGGSAGIGKAIALVFAEAGADVAIAARALERLEETAEEVRGQGRKVLSIQTDVSDRAQVDEMVARTIQELGRIDILVNNAGGSGGGAPVAPLPDPPDRPALGYRNPRDHTAGMTDEAWHRVINLNLSAPFYCCRAVAPQMLERREGKIINIASANAVMAYPYSPAYQSSKAGVRMLTKVLANEWGRYNIKVNAIAPGWFVTEATRAFFESPDNAEWVQAQLSWLPLRRLSDTRDVGLLAFYLASPASDWMTGQLICLDGGETAISN